MMEKPKRNCKSDLKRNGNSLYQNGLKNLQIFIQKAECSLSNFNFGLHAQSQSIPTLSLNNLH